MKTLSSELENFLGEQLITSALSAIYFKRVKLWINYVIPLAPFKDTLIR